jgi:hypothetical protein
LPTIDDWQKIIDPSRTSPAISLGHPFNNVQFRYWASSNILNNPDLAWSVDISDGSVIIMGKSRSNNVWSVSSGQNYGHSVALSVLKYGTGEGAITSSADTANCNSSCSASITYGTNISFIATPKSGSIFTGWFGACSGMGACTVTMDAAKSVTATFALAPTTSKPGDCDNSGTVSIAEVQSAINMFLGVKVVAACVDQDGVGGVSIAEVQKVINGFLGL